jgi:excisionase family DNA binding protein
MVADARDVDDEAPTDVYTPPRGDQGDGARTRQLIIELQAEIRALRGAVSGLEERLPPQLVSVETAARQLSVSVQTIRRWCKAGALPYLRRGRELRIDLSKLKALSGEEVRALARSELPASFRKGQSL